MIGEKFLANHLDDLQEARKTIHQEDSTGRVLLMVCEHTIRPHYAHSGALWQYAHTEDGKNWNGWQPRTRRLGTCPTETHKSRHVFIQAGGRTEPARCRMHPLIFTKSMPVKAQAAYEAALAIGGAPGALEILRKHVQFDAMLWRLWDMVVWYQRAPDRGEYAG